MCVFRTTYTADNIPKRIKEKRISVILIFAWDRLYGLLYTYTVCVCVCVSRQRCTRLLDSITHQHNISRDIMTQTYSCAARLHLPRGVSFLCGHIAHTHLDFFFFFLTFLSSCLLAVIWIRREGFETWFFHRTIFIFVHIDLIFFSDCFPRKSWEYNFVTWEKFSSCLYVFLPHQQIRQTLLLGIEEFHLCM